MKGKILVADDDYSIRDIFQLVLEQAGYEVELKSDASEIFSGKYKKPDLFLIDKLLLGTDGLNVCRFLKKNRKTKNIPVIMISAIPDIGRLASEAGADDYIEKPFKVKYALSVIERYMPVPVKHERRSS